MALVVFLRGVNVGGRRTFRPSALASQLSAFDVVSVGAAGTFVVFKPGPRARFLAELRRMLPFEAVIAVCDGCDLIRLEAENPFEREPQGADLVRFVSILAQPVRRHVALPAVLPEDGEWLVRIQGLNGRLVYGVYRRRMKTIGCLGRIDRLFGAAATTRAWSTITAIVRILQRRSARPGGRALHG